jgi:hypothetical protein
MMNNLHPFTTLEGLKRRATQLKRERGLSHSEALNEVSKAGGYRNYHDAQKVLRAQSPSPFGLRVKQEN